MDRDRGGGRRAGGGDPGGSKGKSSGPAPQFVRNIPNFLQAYSSMLTTNKKNYMGEDLGFDGGRDTAEEVLSKGGVVVRSERDPGPDDGEEDDAPVAVETEDRDDGASHVIFREKAPALDELADLASKNSSSGVDQMARPNEFKKLEFSKPQKRKLTEDEEADQADNVSKRGYKGVKKPVLLSFEVDED